MVPLDKIENNLNILICLTNFCPLISTAGVIKFVISECIFKVASC